MLYNEKTKPPIAANHSISPKLRWMNNSSIRRGNCLKQYKISFTLIDLFTLDFLDFLDLFNSFFYSSRFVCCL